MVTQLMFEHTLTALKGWFDIQGNLDFVAQLSSNVTFTVPAGRVVHVNDSLQFEMGMGQTTMPIYLLQGSDSFDVSNPTFTDSGLFIQQAIAPAGWMSGLVGTGGYELESSEFDDTRDYNPNDLLTAAANNTTLSTGGVLTNAGSGSHGNVKQYIDPVCGVVSRGAYVNAFGVNVIAFWSYFLPAVYS